MYYIVSLTCKKCRTEDRRSAPDSPIAKVELLNQPCTTCEGAKWDIKHEESIEGTPAY